MSKILNGRELADYIKQRQFDDVSRLKQSGRVKPKLAIIQCKDDPVINTYVRLKKQYGSEIGAEVNIHFVDQGKIATLLQKLNHDDSVHGVIVQLPLGDTSQTDEIINLVDPAKDVDALGKMAKFDPATPMAIMWLLSGYNVDLANKEILIIGKGRLVGEPLAKMLKQSGFRVTTADRQTRNLGDLSRQADIIITAAGSPAILYSDMIKHDAVVVDAGTASEDGKTVGDLADEVYKRDDLTLTPKKGGVGPLTVCALFENVIRAVERMT